MTNLNPSSPSITLLAPLSGLLVPIETVPDPVFARKIVGDGASLDPVTQRLLAPCGGEVLNVHASAHALTLRAEGGLEVLLHIGIDTVHMKGEGFKALVKAGDQVQPGQALIDFSADEVALKARSLLTQIIITTPERVAGMKKFFGSVEAGRDPVLTVDLAAAVAAAPGQAGEALVSEAIVVPNPTGLHARPAATLAKMARGYNCDLRLRKGEALANLRSVSAIMGLDVRKGDKVYLVARGEGAKEAIAAMIPAIEQGLGDNEPAPVKAAPAAAAPAAQGEANLIAGIGAAPGLAAGKAFMLRKTDQRIPEFGGSPDQERKRLEEAIRTARLQISALQARLTAVGEADKAGIFGAHLELLDDPDLMELAESAISKGKSAAFAWRGAFTAHADRLSAMSNEILAARAADLRDVGRRALALLGGVQAETPAAPAGSIIIAEELTPSDLASLDRANVLGCATVGGGATAHIAILAQSMGLPLAVAMEPRLLQLADGADLILDGGAGTLRLNPSAADLAGVRERLAAAKERRLKEAQAASQPALTLDGRNVEVVANIGNTAEAAAALKLGAEGVGLLRSEFLFLDRAEAPSEDEQAAAYGGAAAVLGKQRPLVIRTLDIGGDKQAPYLDLPKEENPFLGERGIRVSLARPELLRTQVRAILRASAAGDLRIMFPMISGIDEYRAARSIVMEEAGKLGVKPVPVGLMIEVPAAAVMAGTFAAEADFFSIGTNDLTQYTLAMDRGHPKLAGKADALHPAVLRLISMVVEAAAGHKKPVAVCGGLAGDPKGAALLIGLGVNELSVSAPAIPAVKAAIRKLKLEDCKKLAAAALKCGTAAEVRALAANKENI